MAKAERSSRDVTDEKHRIVLEAYAPEPSVRVGSALRELRRQLPAFRSLLWDPGKALDPSQQDALETLVRIYPDGVPIRILAATLRIDASTTSRIVDRLSDRRLATKTPSRDDARVLLVRPTARGVKLLDQSFWPGRARSAALIEETFTPQELDKLASMLVRLVAAIDRAADEAELGDEHPRGR